MEKQTGIFTQDIQTIRKRAREHIRCGALTYDYNGDLPTILKLLNEALATEIVCTLRYKYHYFAAEGLLSESIKEEFLEHAKEEDAHANMIAQRIIQLDGLPNFNPEGILSRSAAEYVEGGNLVEMLEEDLVAERIAVETYREIIQYIGLTDPTTRRMFEEILAKEEEHADEISSLLENLKSDKDALIRKIA